MNSGEDSAFPLISSSSYGVPDREQVDSERETVEVRDKEKGDKHEETTNLHMTAKSQHRIPHVVFVIFIGIRIGDKGRACKRGRSVGLIHCQPSTEIGGVWNG